MGVKFNIDDTEVEISDVATEATLKKILEHFKGDTPEARKKRKEVEDLADATEELTDEQKKLSGTLLKDSTGSIDEWDHVLIRSRKSVETFGDKVLRAAENIFSAAESVIKFGADTAGVGMNLKSFGSTVEKTASKIPIIGNLLGTASGAVINHTAMLVDSFDTLSRTGSVFSGNLFDIEREAAKAYLKLEDFTKILKDNAVDFRVFGGSARVGAQRFVDINR